MVAVADKPRYPTVLDRRRIELADPKLNGSKQPYHAAEPLPLREAERLLDRCRASTFDLADGAMANVVGELRKRGANVAGCGLLMGSGKTVTDLATILSSHALIHAAEGDFFRNAVAHASEQCGLSVLELREKQAYDRAASELNVNADELLTVLSAMGKAIGSPWTQDEKLAALAAWLVLASVSDSVSNMRRAVSS